MRILACTLQFAYLELEQGRETSTHSETRPYSVVSYLTLLRVRTDQPRCRLPAGVSVTTPPPSRGRPGLLRDALQR